MSDFWIITTHKFFRHTSQAAVEKEAERLRAKAPEKSFTILRVKGSVTPSRSAKIIAALEERNAELLEALRDLLNDCTNFDGGKLTDIFQVNATRVIAKAEGREPQ